jgi:hypothetical protein
MQPRRIARILLGLVADASIACDEPGPDPALHTEERVVASAPPSSVSNTARLAKGAPRSPETATWSGRERILPTLPTPPGRLGKLPADLGIVAGTRAPRFELTSSQGHVVTLGSLLESGPVLLIFYRGGWCPYSAHQLRDLEKLLPELRHVGGDKLR